MPEAPQHKRRRNHTAAMGLFPQGPPDHPQKQHEQHLHGNGVANQDESDYRHNAERLSQRPQLPVYETAKAKSVQVYLGAARHCDFTLPAGKTSYTDKMVMHTRGS